jgi:hypothetical protein
MSDGSADDVGIGCELLPEGPIAQDGDSRCVRRHIRREKAAADFRLQLKHVEEVGGGAHGLQRNHLITLNQIHMIWEVVIRGG